MKVEELRDFVVETLEDMKARDLSVIDVRGKTSITDFMVIASGTSDRHVKAIAEAVAFRAKQKGCPPMGQEGVTDGEWALIDLNSSSASGVSIRPRQKKYCNSNSNSSSSRTRLNGSFRPYLRSA
jgi:ribosome-associated protein